MAEKEFVNGFMVKAPRDGAPDWLKLSISIKRMDLLKWLGERHGEWVNIDVKMAKNGKMYAEVNNWKPDKDKAKKVDKESTPSDREPPYGSLYDDFNEPLPF